MNSGSPARRKRRSYAASSSMGAIEAPGPDTSPPDGEHRLEVVLGEDLEGDHRVGALDAVECRKALRDHLGEPIVLAAPARSRRNPTRR